MHQSFSRLCGLVEGLQMKSHSDLPFRLYNKIPPCLQWISHSLTHGKKKKSSCACLISARLKASDNRQERRGGCRKDHLHHFRGSILFCWVYEGVETFIPGLGLGISVNPGGDWLKSDLNWSLMTWVFTSSSSLQMHLHQQMFHQLERLKPH